jgi:hypothetical protein
LIELPEPRQSSTGSKDFGYSSALTLVHTAAMSMPFVPWGEEPPDEPAGETPAEVLQLLELQAALLRSVATGGPRIETVNNEYQRRRRALNAGLKRLGIDPPFPWQDLWGWYGAWTQYGTYAARRSYVSQLAEPARERLKQIIDGASVIDSGPVRTDWPNLEQRLTDLRGELDASKSLDDLQDVGRRAREVLIDLATLVYRLDMLPANEPEPKAGDAKTRLAFAAASLMPGSAHEDWRKLIRAAWDLANTITHSTSITRVDAFAAVQATVLLVRVFEQATRTE